MTIPQNQSARTIDQPLSDRLDHTQRLSLPPTLAAIVIVSLFLTITVGGALFFFPRGVSAPLALAAKTVQHSIFRGHLSNLSRWFYELTRQSAQRPYPAHYPDVLCIYDKRANGVLLAASAV